MCRIERTKGHNWLDPPRPSRGHTLWAFGRNALPMNYATTIHLLGPTDSASTVLGRDLKSKVAARHWASVPRIRDVWAGDVVVVDLTRPHGAIDPRHLQPLLGCATLCLLPGNAP